MQAAVSADIAIALVSSMAADLHATLPGPCS